MTKRPPKSPTRRTILAGVGLAVPALWLGHRALAPVPGVNLPWAERLAYRTHRLIVGDALAREYAPADISPHFPPNGTKQPDTKEYARHQAADFRTWELKVDGLVKTPLRLSLEVLRKMPARRQITRHDCVEGWSAIAEWRGVPLKVLLDQAGLLPQARFIVFHCADNLMLEPYYESIDLADAFHAQTILAHEMNGKALPIGHGAPLRLRVERQLGYKHAKYVHRIEAVDRLDTIRGGRGGFWEDFDGYEWYAGI